MLYRDIKKDLKTNKIDQNRVDLKKTEYILPKVQDMNEFLSPKVVVVVKKNAPFQIINPFFLCCVSKRLLPIFLYNVMCKEVICL